MGKIVAVSPSPEALAMSIADRELLPSFSPSEFIDTADAFQEKLALVEEAANQPLESRVLRPFKTSEIIELTGLSDRQVRSWRQAHFKELSNIGSNASHPLTLDEVHRLMEDYGVRPRRPDGSRAMRLGIFNFKGGSTKSATALHLSVYAAFHGYRVLLIDGDPQGSLTSLFGRDPADVAEELSLAPVFRSVREKSSLDAVTLSPQPTHIAGLDLVPACLGMIGADMAIANAFVSRAPAVRTFYECVSRAIASVEDRYDLVLMDGSPAFSFAALAALWAMDGMVIPMPPEAPDFKATGSFLSMIGDTLQSLCESAGRPEREWSPTVVVHGRAKNSQSAALIKKLTRDVLAHRRLDDVIPDVSAVPNALARFRSVYEVTGNEIDSRALRKARDSYNAVNRQIIDFVHRAWRTGIALEGELP